METESSNKSSYGKRPTWQWIALYTVIAVVVYGAFYYFVLAKKGGYSAPTTYSNTTTNTTNLTPSSTNQTISKNEVTISNYVYGPASLTVKVGDTVKWTNQDSVQHSATSDDGTFDTGLFSKGQSKTVTFDKAGTYKYHCSLHPRMLGTIIVE